MSVFLKRAAICLSMSVFFTGCAVTPPQSNPAKLTLNADNKKSAVVVKLEGKNVNYFGVNSLSIIKYHENKADHLPPVHLTSRFIDLKYMVNTGGYAVAEIPPGTYFLAYASMPKLWAGCFNRSTVKFEVKPDKVTYLGQINLDEFHDELTNHIKTYKGDKVPQVSLENVLTSVYKYQPKNYKSDLIYTPKFENTDPQSYKAVSEFLTKKGAKVDVPVEATEFEPMSFPVGKDGCAKVPL